jgi:hypothetical protein
MADLVRAAGHAPQADGEAITWSVAAGRRGRRWREGLVRHGAVARTLVLETDPAGRTTRLEVATSAGLLTLHPEPDESALHGNVVTPAGIVHLALGWSPRHLLLVEGSSIGSAALAWGLRARSRAGDGPVALAAVVVDEHLEPRPATLWVARPDATWWSVHAGDPGRGTTIRIDSDGLPVLEDGAVWPLEVESG